MFRMFRVTTIIEVLRSQSGMTKLLGSRFGTSSHFSTTAIKEPLTGSTKIPTGLVNGQVPLSKRTWIIQFGAVGEVGIVRVHFFADETNKFNGIQSGRARIQEAWDRYDVW